MPSSLFGPIPLTHCQLSYIRFYSVVVQELVSNTLISVLTVTAITLIFLPHWTAALYVFPFLCFLYIDMLGFLYITGVQINAIR
jgi:hypothetical protein